jgi:membrane-associated PAP2 superfamily phosphatase
MGLNRRAGLGKLTGALRQLTAGEPQAKRRQRGGKSRLMMISRHPLQRFIRCIHAGTINQGYAGLGLFFNSVHKSCARCVEDSETCRRTTGLAFAPVAVA